MPRKALGRGLNALLQTVESTTSGLEEVPLDRIDANPSQPRHDFSEDSLRELADSIRASGIVQPVLLRLSPLAEGRYQLVVGERRWRAASLAGLETVPAVIRQVTDQDALEFALTENLLRQDLNPLDVARAFQALQEKYHLSHEQIAERMGVNRSSVTNTLRLLRLPPAVQEMLSKSEITHGHARALLALNSEAAQTQLASMIAKRGLSVRQIENMVALQGTKPAAQKIPSKPRLDANVRAAALELERTLGTRVKIFGNGRRGKIEIHYFSAEDLSRIYDLIVRPR
jgi:ParB family chromosome partitioning protein